MEELFFVVHTFILLEFSIVTLFKKAIQLIGILKDMDKEF
jgi:hypothetical protein